MTQSDRILFEYVVTSIANLWQVNSILTDESNYFLCPVMPVLKQNRLNCYGE